MKIRLISALAIGLLTSACGSSSGVDGNKPLSDLDRDDAERLCEFAGDLMADISGGSKFQRAMCSIQGYAMEQARLGTCEDIRDECLSAEPGDDDFIEEEIGDVCDDDSFDFAPSCDVTVKEFEDCMRAVRDRMRDSFNNVTCDNLREAEEDESLEDFYDVSGLPECEGLAERCDY